MTPKEKADKLVDSFLTASFGTMEEYIPVPYPFAKQCALISVDEILSIPFKINCDASERCVNAVIDYYNEVIIEISKL